MYEDIEKEYGSEWDEEDIDQDEVSGFIWVLSTCIFLVPDYILSCCKAKERSE